MIQAAGVYQIRNTLNGKVYIGSSVSFDRRWALHRRSLRKGTHHTVGLQRAWSKYGEEAFVFEPLLVCAPEMLLFYEQRAIDTMKPRYNSARHAGSTLGLKMSPQAKANLSAGQKGKQFSTEHKAKLSEKLRGRPCSERTLAVLRGNKGRKHSPETVEKNRQAHVGLRLSPEAKAKVSAAVKGREVTAETRAKLSAAARRRVPPAQSAETRAKRSASIARYWAAKRAAL